MNYMQAWRDGHKEGMELSLKLINELTGQQFQSASEVVLYIKELESERKKSFYDNSELSEKDVKMIDSLSQKIAINNWLWSD